MSWFGAWAGAWIQGWSGSIAGGLPANVGPSWASPMSLVARQNTLSPPAAVRAFRAGGFVDFTGYTALAFRMVGSVVVTGAATGSADGVLIYYWVTGDLAVAGTYEAVFTAIDPTGRPEEFPTGANLALIVVPAL